MDAQLLHALTLRETDVQGALRRLGDDESLYIECLAMFLHDPTMDELNEAIDNKAWDEAFTAAHALKGVAGNMGFVPLMHATGQLVIVIRGGRIKDIGESMAQVNSHYRDIMDVVRAFFVRHQQMGGN